MTPRSLFVIIIKVLGILMLKDLIISGTNVISNLLMLSSGYYPNGWIGLIGPLLGFGLNAAVFYILIFKPELLINKLKLDHGFYEEIFSMQLDPTWLLNIGIIAAGIYLLVESVPNLLRDVVAYYQQVNSAIGDSSTRVNRYAQDMAYDGVKLIAAYVMLVNNGYITDFIMSRRKTKEE